MDQDLAFELDDELERGWRLICIGSPLSDCVLRRADRLRETPAAVRFISAEPLLGPLEVNLGGIDWGDQRGLPSLSTTMSACQWPGTARPGDRRSVGQADREPAVSSSELSTSSP
jgi:hypothetical protein